MARIWSSTTGTVGSLLLLLFATTTFLVVEAQDEITFALDDPNNSTSVTCPPRRFFDTEAPLVERFGAPTGCSCYEGLSGLGCGYCENDAACQRYDSTHTCEKGSLSFEPGDAQKAYYCRLSGILTTLYGNGQLSILFDVPSRSGNLTLYQKTDVDGLRAIDCYFEDCDFGVDPVVCEDVTCQCAEQCQTQFLDFYKALVLGIRNSRAEFTIGEKGDSGHDLTGQRKVKVDMAGDAAPFILDAYCSAQTCRAPLELQNTPDLGDVLLPQASDAVPVGLQQPETTSAASAFGTMFAVLNGAMMAVYFLTRTLSNWESVED